MAELASMWGTPAIIISYYTVYHNRCALCCANFLAALMVKQLTFNDYLHVMYTLSMDNLHV